MTEGGGAERKGGPVTLAQLVGKALDPVTARRGFATAALMTGWSEVVGARYADCSRPEKIVWPRGEANAGAAGVLVVRIEGPRALLFQHEVGQIVERVNAFIGHGAIGKVRIVQGPVGSAAKLAEAPAKPLDPRDESALAAVLAGVEGEALRAALDRLGRAVIGERDKKS